MKQTIMFSFITIGVFLFVSSASAAPGRPVYDISGKWYVVAAKGYKAPILKCWTLEITPSESEKSFSVVSVATDPGTEDSEKTILDITRDDVNNGYGGDQTQWFNFKRETSDVGNIGGSMKFYYNTHDPVVAIEDFHIEGVNFDLWEKLFISRRSDITSDMVPFADSLINNSGCESELDKVEIY